MLECKAAMSVGILSLDWLAAEFGAVAMKLPAVWTISRSRHSIFGEAHLLGANSSDLHGRIFLGFHVEQILSST